MPNIILIGLPGAGKSTLGVILAKSLRKRFVDTDLLIQEETGRHLQEILDTDGTDAFIAIEEATILAARFRNTVVATGGSVIFSAKAMEHLRRNGIILYLKISCDEMMQRLDNITTRGIVLHPGESLAGMYAERVPLYEKYADITVECSDRHFEECVREVIAGLQKPRG